MGISYTNKDAANAEGGWNFQGELNGQLIVFSASSELLQDIEPSIRMQPAGALFRTHQYRLQRIADAKVAKYGVPMGNPAIVHLTTADIGLST